MLLNYVIKILSIKNLTLKSETVLINQINLIKFWLKEHHTESVI